MVRELFLPAQALLGQKQAVLNWLLRGLRGSSPLEGRRPEQTQGCSQRAQSNVFA